MQMHSLQEREGRKSRGWIDLHLYAMASATLLSGLLLWWTNVSWRENFEAYPPILDSLRHARADIVKGYLAIERHLAGELHIRLVDADAFFEQAIQEVNDVGQAMRADGILSPFSREASDFQSNLDLYRTGIVRFQKMTSQGLSADEESRRRYGVERQAAFAGLEKLADALDDEIQHRITIAALRQDRLNTVLFLAWLSFLFLLAISLALAGGRRRKAEQAMVESEEKYRLLFDQVMDVILLVDEETDCILDCNQAVTTEWGYAREALLLQKPSLLRVTSPHPETTGPETNAYAYGRRALVRESRLSTRSGEFRDVSIKTGFFILQDRPVRLEIFRDVTERRKDERALREREAMLRSLGDNLPDGLVYEIEVMPDGHRRFRYISQGIERIFGLPVALALEDSQAVFDLINAEDRERLLEAESASLAHLTNFDVQARVQTRDGTLHWGQFRAAPRRAYGGSVLFDGVYFDVTAQKHAEENLLQAKKEAEAASLSKSEFLANISHEVRTPLNGVLGMLQLLETSSLSPEDASHVTTALSCGRGLVKVLADILDFSLIDAGRLLLHQDVCDIRAVVSETLGVFAIECEKKGLKAAYDVADSVPVAVMTDAARLRQILFNVIGNAVKFTTTGWIHVSVDGVSRHNQAVHVLFIVTDSGIGIPEDKIDAIFEPFTQLDGSLTRKYGGTGLGLGIVKRLVSLLDGQMTVTSTVGSGSEFSFTICCGEAASLPVAAPAPVMRRTVGVGSPIRVLVVEDEAVNRMATVSMLKKLGFMAEAVEDGDKALDILVGNSFDVVLMDIQMPRLSGDAATRYIRQGKKPGVDPGIPIIALTAHAMEGDRERYLACGMDDYLSKPVDLDALGLAVTRAAASRCVASER